MRTRQNLRGRGSSWWCAVLATAALLLSLGTSPAHAEPQVDPFGLHTPILVAMDTSLSMNDRITDSGVTSHTRIQAARSAVLDLVGSLGDEQPFGLIAYPGRSADVVDGCSVGRVEVPPGPLDVGAAAAAVRRLTPDGDTPTGPALKRAADVIRDTYGPGARGVIVLVSDGESNCGEPPVCEVASAIRASGLEVQINTVGLHLDGPGEDEMRCVADATGGRYIDAGDGSGDELSAAIAASAHAALSLTVDAPSSIRVVNHADTTGGGDVVVTIRSTGRVLAADVRVSLVVKSTDRDGATSTVLVPRPVRFLGNIEQGKSRSVTFAVHPDDLDQADNMMWTVTATAMNAAPAISSGTFAANGSLAPSELGGVLAGIESVVVLGDSYSSGEGAGSYEEDTDGDDGESSCHRSTSTYAHAIWGSRTTVIACSGAVTADFSSSQKSGDVSMTPQLTALRELMLGDDPPGAVLLSIGGNDAGFGTIGARCVYGNYLSELARPGAYWPVGWRCDQGLEFHWAGTRTSTSDALERAMAIKGDVTAVLREVDAAVNDDTARNNRDQRDIPIVVVPYPRIVPETQPGNAAPSGCAVGIGGSELGYLNQFFDAINTSVSLAAYTLRNDQRPVYLATSVEDAFQPDHTICEGELSYGVTVSTASLSSEPALSIGQLLDSQELLHPTPAGHAATARAIVAWSQTRAAQQSDYSGAPVWKEHVPLGLLGAVQTPFLFSHGQAGGSMVVDAGGFIPGSSVVIAVESDPRVLGTAVTDDGGRVSTVVQLPADLPAGEHHSVVTGTGVDGSLRAVAARVVVMPQGGVWLYLALGVGVALTVIAAAIRPWRRSAR